MWPGSPASIVFAHSGRSPGPGEECRTPITLSSDSELAPLLRQPTRKRALLSWCKCGSQGSPQSALVFLFDLISETRRLVWASGWERRAGVCPSDTGRWYQCCRAQGPGNVYSTVSSTELIWPVSAAEWRCQMVAGVCAITFWRSSPWVWQGVKRLPAVSPKSSDVSHLLICSGKIGDDILFLLRTY